MKKAQAEKKSDHGRLRKPITFMFAERTYEREPVSVLKSGEEAPYLFKTMGEYIIDVLLEENELPKGKILLLLAAFTTSVDAKNIKTYTNMR